MRFSFLKVNEIRDNSRRNGNTIQGKGKGWKPLGGIKTRKNRKNTVKPQVRNWSDDWMIMEEKVGISPMGANKAKNKLV